MKNSLEAKVSVLMPVYNGQKFLREAIVSVLTQTFRDFEFLIINDGSTDQSVDIINSYDDPRIYLVHNSENLGLIATLNRGLSLARGEYIARMDCDDISLPDRLNKQVEFMDHNPDVGICGAWVRTIGDRPGRIFKYAKSPDIIESQLLLDSCLAHPSVLMRRTMLDQHGLKYEHSYIHAEDWRLWQRASKHFPISNVSEILLEYRFTSSSVSRANEAEQLRTIKTIDRENLSNLGIDASAHELNLHRLIGGWKFLKNTEFVEQSDQWLVRLVIANRTKGIYPKAAFEEVLATRFFLICRFAECCGLRVFRHYLRSTLKPYRYVGFRSTLRFFCHCFRRSLV